MNTMAVVLSKGILTVTILMFGVISAPGQAADQVQITKDIIYGHAGGVDLKLDMAKARGGMGPFPVLVFFHGGGWQQGHKSHMHRWLRKFSQEGYVTVTVGYRFAPEFKWPSQVEDAKAAIRFLRANAKAYDIDPGRIGVMGESAGGYLALMLGVTEEVDGLEGSGGSQDFSSNVRAVVSYFSAGELAGRPRTFTPEIEKHLQDYYQKSLTQVLQDFTGAKDEHDPVFKKISVFSYIDKKDPPVLLFQGDSDPFITVAQAQKLDAAFEKVNVPHELVIVKGGGHGWTGSLEEETTLKMMGFFETLLKRKH